MMNQYKVSGGLHGVGISAVNALSSELIAEVRRSGYLWRQKYSEGAVQSDVEQIRPLEAGESTGTSITFTPDFAIMDEGLTFDYDLIVERCKQLAYLLPGLTFSIEQEYGSKENHSLKQANGLADWVTDLNRESETLHRVLHKDNRIEFKDRENNPYDIRVMIAFQFVLDKPGIIKSFVNTLATPDAGTHVEGLEESLIDAIYGDIGRKLIEPLNGLVAVLHVYHPDPQFHSQTTVQLLNPEVKDVVAECVEQLLAENLDIHAQLQGYFKI